MSKDARLRRISKPTRRGDTAALGDIAQQLHSAAIHLLRRLRRADDQMGLSGPRASALSVLVFGGPTSLAQLAKAEQVKPPTMARLVDALEAAGLARREADQSDLRAVRIKATAKGRKLDFGWDLVQIEGGALVGINTGHANRLVAEAQARRAYPDLGRDRRNVRRENSVLRAITEPSAG